MHRDAVAFVAFQEQDNLGVGYLASMALEAGFRPAFVDVRLGAAAVAGHIRRLDPIAIGFSVIFQYHIADFRELVRRLRQDGIHQHFCAGGHYPSLRPRELLEFIPELDSVVLFEGEHTFLELILALKESRSWRGIAGLAHRHGAGVQMNPLRPLEPDLDRFPPPVRPPLKEYAFGKKYATMLAGRGCLYNCTFCSIRQFYAQPPGPLKRLRRPEMVVREMELLHEQKDCSIFMFQDDDFPVGAGGGRNWALRFCELLEEAGLARKVLWKINCRPDEVDDSLFCRLQDCGLFLVYLGIEAGTDEGLRLMNKHMNAARSLRAAESLRRIGLLFDFGFMLFDPDSTFASVRGNLDFLEALCSDGCSPVTFCKMLPYAETAVERRLVEQGRLRGADGFEDYEFPDGRMGRYCDFMTGAFEDWMSRRDGLLTRSRWARYHLATYQKYFPAARDSRHASDGINGIVRDGNRLFLRVAREAAGYCERGEAVPAGLGSQIATAHADLNARLGQAVECLWSAASAGNEN